MALSGTERDATGLPIGVAQAGCRVGNNLFAMQTGRGWTSRVETRGLAKRTFADRQNMSPSIHWWLVRVQMRLPFFNDLEAITRRESQRSPYGSQNTAHAFSADQNVISDHRRRSLDSVEGLHPLADANAGI